MAVQCLWWAVCIRWGIAKVVLWSACVSAHPIIFLWTVLCFDGLKSIRPFLSLPMEVTFKDRFISLYWFWKTETVKKIMSVNPKGNSLFIGLAFQIINISKLLHVSLAYMTSFMILLLQVIIWKALIITNVQAKVGVCILITLHQHVCILQLQIITVNAN